MAETITVVRTVAARLEAKATAEPTPEFGRDLGPLDRLPRESMPESALGSANFIFRIWVVIFALVGAQMGWLLRPFIGSPGMPFTWFRERQGSFFEALVNHVRSMIGG